MPVKAGHFKVILVENLGITGVLSKFPGGTPLSLLWSSTPRGSTTNSPSNSILKLDASFWPPVNSYVHISTLPFTITTKLDRMVVAVQWRSQARDLGIYP